jgi:hypothetical protein
MRRLAPAALLFACACASAPPPAAPAARRHYVHITGESVLATFVEANASEKFEILTINLSGKPTSLDALSGMKAVHTLALTGFPNADKASPKDGTFTFPAGLTDAQVNGIAGMSTLRRLDLWYCSLTEAQRELLRRRLPQCEIHENLNKL